MNGLPMRWRVRATAASLILPPLVHVVPLPTLTRWLTRFGNGGSQAGVTDPALGQWVDSVLSRLPGPWQRTCLKRALVLYYLLRRAGHAAELHIGVRRGQRQPLEAHAWLERDGAPVLEADADHIGSYQVLSRFS